MHVHVSALHITVSLTAKELLPGVTAPYTSCTLFRRSHTRPSRIYDTHTVATLRACSCTQSWRHRTSLLLAAPVNCYRRYTWTPSILRSVFIMKR